MDGILEYTSAARLPSVFSESAEDFPIPAAMELPKRMPNTQLHRYSKVLESNLGEGGELGHSTHLLPTCPHLKWAQPHPLNRTAPSNLYKAQKLLSLSLEGLPAGGGGGLVPPPRDGGSPDDALRARADGEAGKMAVDDWLGGAYAGASYPNYASGSGDGDSSLFDLQEGAVWAWIFLLLCVVCYFSYRYCRTRYRLRRRTKPRLKKLISAVSGPRNV